MNIAIKNPTSDKFKLKIEAMLSIMDKLCSVLAKENEVLEKNKVKNIERLIDPKIKLINIYTEKFNALTADKDSFSSLDKSYKEEIAKKAGLLQSLMERNERLLNVNINSTKRLINMIVTDAQKFESEKSGVYSASGRLGHDNKKVSNLTYNQVL